MLVFKECPSKLVDLGKHIQDLLTTLMIMTLFWIHLKSLTGITKVTYNS